MAFPSPSHDHSRCAADIVAHAERICGASGARLTAQRRDVLLCVAQSHAAVGAYDIIERMAQRGARPAPITVYRALEFLQEQNLVHRLESRNAYVACAEEHNDGAPAALLVCETCGNVAELVEEKATGELSAAAARQGFAVKRAIVELSGTCGHCGVT